MAIRSKITDSITLIPTLRVQFGRRLRYLREERALTQEQFAEVVGISVDFLSLIERGINAPSFETIELIASRLEITVASLFIQEDCAKK